ncbi:hypothetical protein FHX81_5655 [Saccharothrix saharensis]|uniref:Minor structural protein GP20 n=1 Tax=Saccharothrix saharensis TaxID=571190 RepID=A0A543JK56_9PSEU|nr:hypothetical protein [Saccharothrix saharensis]TQM83237.1 hypothetical protein FHX81_5655 [Saccharothrix saharensis]
MTLTRLTRKGVSALSDNPTTPPTEPPAQPPTSPPPTPEPPAPTPPAEGTGKAAEPDYRALYAEIRTKLTHAEQTAREHKAKASKLDEIEAANKTDAEKAAERATAAEAQLAALRRVAVDAEIRAAASGWADPTDAPRYLDDRDRYLSEDGTLDTAAIAADLAAVLTARPHLARVDGPRRPAPDPSQGQRQGGPSGVAEQIREAESRGDWATAISLKNRIVAEQARAAAPRTP